jgi:protein-tyrosine phosphatase
VLQVAAAFKPAYPSEFIYKVINVLDMPFANLAVHFKEGIAFINQALSYGGTVLVHCYAGVSRSATIVIAYLMQEKRLTFMDALNYLRRKRPIVCPNFGFQ